MVDPVPMIGAIPNLAAVARVLSRFHRPQLAAFIAVAIDILDTLDGDPDAETIDDDWEPIDEREPDNRDAQFADYGVDQSGWIMNVGRLERENA